MKLYSKFLIIKMFETKCMFVFHVFNGCVGNCCATLQEVSFSFTFKMTHSAVCLTVRVPIAEMLLLVAASGLGLFTSAAFYFLKILFFMSN